MNISYSCRCAPTNAIILPYNICLEKISCSAKNTELLVEDDRTSDFFLDDHVIVARFCILCN